MKTHILSKAVLLGAALSLAALPVLGAADHAQVFRDAYFLETHEQDLAGAAKIYQQLVQAKGVPPAIRAEAQARLACCAEDLKAADLASLMPPDTFVYAELSCPGEHLENLAQMLGVVGQPLESIGQPSYPMPDVPGLVIPRKILLSPAVLAQAKAFKGVAIAMTGLDLEEETPKGVLVIHPGEADALRGAIETMAQFVRPAEPVNGFPAIEIAEDDFSATIAFTARLVVLGTDRALVEGVVQRLSGASTESLAASAVFREEAARRENAMVYGFIDAQKALQIAYRAAAQDRSMAQDLGMAQAFFDLAHLRYASVSLGTSDKDLFGEFVLSLDEGQTSLVYNLMRTPPMRGRALKLVPADAAAVLAIGINPDFTKSGKQDVATKTQTLQMVTGLDVGRELFANIREVAVYITVPDAEGRQASGPQMIPDVGMVLAVGDPDKSEALWSYLLSLPARVAGAPQAAPESTTVEGVAVQTYPMAEGVNVYLARTPQAMLVGMSPEVIKASLRAMRSGKSVLDEPAMKAATKQIGDDTSVVVFGHAGRLAQVAAAHAPPRSEESMILDLVSRAAPETMLTMLIDESPTRLRISGNLAGLPRLEDIMSVLADAGVFGAPSPSLVQGGSAEPVTIEAAQDAY